MQCSSEHSMWTGGACTRRQERAKWDCRWFQCSVPAMPYTFLTLPAHHLQTDIQEGTETAKVGKELLHAPPRAQTCSSSMHTSSSAQTPSTTHRLALARHGGRGGGSHGDAGGGHRLLRHARRLAVAHTSLHAAVGWRGEAGTNQAVAGRPAQVLPHRCTVQALSYCSKLQGHMQ